MVLVLLACLAAPDEAPKRQSDGTEVLPADSALSWTECATPQPVRLNEVVSANLHGAVDEDGDSSDWLELGLSDGAGPTTLDGWSVADAAEKPWALPATTLAATPLQVWASSKNRQDPPLHADFSLDALGDELFLYAPEGCVADHVALPRLYADVALGRAVDGSWAYFLESTPGASNTTESRPDFAPTPSIDTPGGFVPAGSEIVASGTGVLRYTTDGRVPNEDDAVWGGANVASGGTALRIRSFVDGLWPSRVASRTWFTDTDVQMSGVTVIELTVEPDDLFDRETGIYELGPDYEPWYPYFGANFWEVWERDAHVEIFAPGGTPIADQDGGIQIAGGYSRAFDQRNFDIIARSAYGPDTFAAHVFKEETIGEFRTLYLRNGGDWCGTQLVDAAVGSLFRDGDGARNEAVDAQAYTPALVYINGEFWGLYELLERLDEDWPAAHHGADPNNLDFLKLGWTHEANWTAESGDWVAFDQMNTLAAGDLTDAAAWDAFDALVDGDNLAATTVVQGWIGNTDWWGNNLRLWRERTDAGQFRWMAYDFGHGWPDYAYDHLATTTSGSWPGLPIGAALQDAAFRDRFVNIHADFLNTVLRPDAASAKVAALADEVRPVMAWQRDRWCGGAPMRDWEAQVAYAERFAEERPAYVDAQLMEHVGLEGHAGLHVEVTPADSGRVHLAVVTVTPPFDGVYYQGVPVTISALPNDGFRFVGWSGGVSGAANPALLPMSADTSVVAEFEPI